MPKSSKHLDNNDKATRASGESKKTGLMDGIVGGIPKRLNPPVVDGIVRGIAKSPVSAEVSSVIPSATKNSKGAFGAGNFPEGK
jgi:hypothetical protein